MCVLPPTHATPLRWVLPPRGIRMSIQWTSHKTLPGLQDHSDAHATRQRTLSHTWSAPAPIATYQIPLCYLKRDSTTYHHNGTAPEPQRKLCPDSAWQWLGSQWTLATPLLPPNYGAFHSSATKHCGGNVSFSNKHQDFSFAAQKADEVSKTAPRTSLRMQFRQLPHVPFPI